MAFDPDAFLAESKPSTSPVAGGFDPDKFLSDTSLTGRIEAPSDFRSQYIEQAQRSLPERIGDAFSLVPKALGGLYDLGAQGFQGMVNMTGNVAGDLMAADQLPIQDQIGAKLAALGRGGLQTAQTAAEIIPRTSFDIGQGLRNALESPTGLAYLSSVVSPAVGLPLLAQQLSSHTPGELELALAEQSNKDAQLNAAAAQAGLLPEFTGQKAEPGVVNLGSALLGMLGGGGGAKQLQTEARVARAAEAAANIPPPIPGVPPPIPVVPPKSFGTKVSEAIQAPIERAKVNIADKKAQQAAIQALPEPAQKAISSGIEFRDAELFSAANQSERPILQQMARESEAFSKSRSASDPALIVGNQVNQRRIEIKKLLDKVGEEQGALTEALPKNIATNAEELSLNQMRQVPGLKGLTLDSEGMLNFNNTTLSGSGTKAERSALQSHFNDLQGRSPYQLDLLRKEIFNSEFGKIGITAKNATLDQGLEAIRQGAADAIEAISPEYRSLNQQYAQLRKPLDEMAKFFRNVEGAPENIQDLNASFLGRRLTSNAPSNATLSGLLENMETQLASNGINFPISVRKSQDMLNSLSRYYDITHDTSLAGQIQAARGSIPTSLKSALSQGAGKVSEVISRTDAVKRQALKDLIGH